MAITTLAQQSGVNVQNMYSNRLFTNINADSPPDQRVPANLATQLAGVAQCLGAIGAFQTVKRYRRRALYLRSQFLVAATLAFFAFFIHQRMGWPSLCSMLAFQVAYQLGAGGVHWLYLADILSDVQFGFISTVHYCNGIEVAVLTEYMLEYLTPEGTFLYYSLISLAGYVFYLGCLKETAGLTDR